MLAQLPRRKSKSRAAGNPARVLLQAQACKRHWTSRSRTVERRKPSKWMTQKMSKWMMQKIFEWIVKGMDAWMVGMVGVCKQLRPVTMRTGAVYARKVSRTAVRAKCMNERTSFSYRSFASSIVSSCLAAPRHPLTWHSNSRMES